MTSAAFNPNLAAVAAPPVMEARRWVAETKFPAERPLLNLSQAAPVDPPPESLRRAMADTLLREAEAHLYGPVLGDPALRERVAAEWSEIYGGEIEASDVAITAGCNQAFCAAVATLAAPGDGVMLPVPWYFNHAMWLGMSGVEAQPLPCGDGMLPDPEDAARRITPATRALTLVTPNNPTGAEYPPDLIEAFFDLCAERGIALILDETYRDFHSDDGPPHRLFERADWRERLIHLYSFSKVYRLTGHRTGAIVAGAARLAAAEKFLDTVTICAPRTGQLGALHGLEHLRQWVAGERAEILARRAALQGVFAKRLPDWQLLGAGAYFAYVEPPYDIPSPELCRRLVAEQSLLFLPGTMFTPGSEDWGGSRQIRIAFANADAAGLATMGERLAAFRI